MGLKSSPPCALCKQPEGGFTSTPLKSAAKVGEDYSLLPQQKKVRESLLTSTVCPPGYEMQMAM